MTNRATEKRGALSVAVLTLFPEMFSALTDWGVTGRARDQGLYGLELVNPRAFATDRHGTVDDRPYGGGPGMVMQAPLMEQAVLAAEAALGVGRGEAPVVAMTPQGEPLTDALVSELAASPSLVLVAGRYEGIDERFMEMFVTREVSLGDFVVSGGELPAMMLLDAMIRRLPGALGHAASAEEDSFVDGLLDCPHYTRPEVYREQRVPAVLLSGDHGAIARWRRQQALVRTLQRRPDLLAGRALSEEDKALLDEWRQQQLS
jgi:tRNA (guanine37-N1)-methyltransferase